MQIKRYLCVCWSRYTLLYENKSRTNTAAYAPAVIGSVFFTKIQIIVGTVYFTLTDYNARLSNLSQRWLELMMARYVRVMMYWPRPSLSLVCAMCGWWCTGPVPPSSWSALCAGDDVLAQALPLPGLLVHRGGRQGLEVPHLQQSVLRKESLRE